MKYAAVFDEALCSSDGATEAVCDRAGSDKNPHRHFNVFQFEIDDNGNLKECVITPSMHQKEIMEITKEFAKIGVSVYLPEALEARVKSQGQRVTLTREKQGNQVYFFVDVRDESDASVRMLTQMAVNKDNYLICQALMLEKASLFNLPHEDRIREVALDLANVSK